MTKNVKSDREILDKNIVDEEDAIESYQSAKEELSSPSARSRAAEIQSDEMEHKRELIEEKGKLTKSFRDVFSAKMEKKFAKMYGRPEHFEKEKKADEEQHVGDTFTKLYLQFGQESENEHNKLSYIPLDMMDMINPPAYQRRRPHGNTAKWVTSNNLGYGMKKLEHRAPIVKENGDVTFYVPRHRINEHSSRLGTSISRDRNGNIIDRGERVGGKREEGGTSYGYGGGDKFTINLNDPKYKKRVERGMGDGPYKDGDLRIITTPKGRKLLYIYQTKNKVQNIANKNGGSSSVIVPGEGGSWEIPSTMNGQLYISSRETKDFDTIMKSPYAQEAFLSDDHIDFTGAGDKDGLLVLLAKEIDKNVAKNGTATKTKYDQFYMVVGGIIEDIRDIPFNGDIQESMKSPEYQKVKYKLDKFKKVLLETPYRSPFALNVMLNELTADNLRDPHNLYDPEDIEKAAVHMSRRAELHAMQSYVYRTAMKECLDSGMDMAKAEKEASDRVQSAQAVAFSTDGKEDDEDIELKEAFIDSTVDEDTREAILDAQDEEWDKWIADMKKQFEAKGETFDENSVELVRAGEKKLRDGTYIPTFTVQFAVKGADGVPRAMRMDPGEYERHLTLAGTTGVSRKTQADKDYEAANPDMEKVPSSQRMNNALNDLIEYRINKRAAKLPDDVKNDPAEFKEAIKKIHQDVWAEYEALPDTKKVELINEFIKFNIGRTGGSDSKVDEGALLSQKRDAALRDIIKDRVDQLVAKLPSELRNASDRIKEAKKSIADDVKSKYLAYSDDEKKELIAKYKAEREASTGLQYSEKDDAAIWDRLLLKEIKEQVEKIPDEIQNGPARLEEEIRRITQSVQDKIKALPDTERDALINKQLKDHKERYNGYSFSRIDPNTGELIEPGAKGGAKPIESVEVDNEDLLGIIDAINAARKLNREFPLSNEEKEAILAVEKGGNLTARAVLDVLELSEDKNAARGYISNKIVRMSNHGGEEKPKHQRSKKDSTQAQLDYQKAQEQVGATFKMAKDLIMQYKSALSNIKEMNRYAEQLIHGNVAESDVMVDDNRGGTKFVHDKVADYIAMHRFITQLVAGYPTIPHQKELMHSIIGMVHKLLVKGDMPDIFQILPDDYDEGKIVWKPQTTNADGHIMSLPDDEGRTVTEVAKSAEDFKSKLANGELKISDHDTAVQWLHYFETRDAVTAYLKENLFDVRHGEQASDMVALSEFLHNDIDRHWEDLINAAVPKGLPDKIIAIQTNLHNFLNYAKVQADTAKANWDEALGIQTEASRAVMEEALDLEKRRFNKKYGGIIINGESWDADRLVDEYRRTHDGNDPDASEFRKMKAAFKWKVLHIDPAHYVPKSIEEQELFNQIYGKTDPGSLTAAKIIAQFRAEHNGRAPNRKQFRAIVKEKQESGELNTMDEINEYYKNLNDPKNAAKFEDQLRDPHYIDPKTNTFVNRDLGEWHKDKDSLTKEELNELMRDSEGGLSSLLWRKLYGETMEEFYKRVYYSVNPHEIRPEEWAQFVEQTNERVQRWDPNIISAKGFALLTIKHAFETLFKDHGLIGDIEGLKDALRTDAENLVEGLTSAYKAKEYGPSPKQREVINRRIQEIAQHFKKYYDRNPSMKELMSYLDLPESFTNKDEEGLDREVDMGEWYKEAGDVFSNDFDSLTRDVINQMETEQQQKLSVEEQQQERLRNQYPEAEYTTDADEALRNDAWEEVISWFNAHKGRFPTDRELVELKPVVEDLVSKEDRERTIKRLPRLVEHALNRFDSKGRHRQGLYVAHRDKAFNVGSDINADDLDVPDDFWEGTDFSTRGIISEYRSENPNAISTDSGYRAPNSFTVETSEETPAKEKEVKVETSEETPVEEKVEKEKVEREPKSAVINPVDESSLDDPTSHIEESADPEFPTFRSMFIKSRRMVINKVRGGSKW